VSGNELDMSDIPYTHLHEWRVEARIGNGMVSVDGELRETGPVLLLRCEPCGARGMVNDPSPAELRRASKLHRWFAHHRIRLIVRTEEIHRTWEDDS
jgi:hypothetical protein